MQQRPTSMVEAGFSRQPSHFKPPAPISPGRMRKHSKPPPPLIRRSPSLPFIRNRPSIPSNLMSLPDSIQSMENVLNPEDEERITRIMRGLSLHDEGDAGDEGEMNIDDIMGDDDPFRMPDREILRSRR